MIIVMGNKSFQKSVFPSVCFHKIEGWPDWLVSRVLVRVWRGVPRAHVATSGGILGVPTLRVQHWRLMEEANSSRSCALFGPLVQSGHLGDPCPPGTRVASVWPHPSLNFVFNDSHFFTHQWLFLYSFEMYLLSLYLL